MANTDTPMGFLPRYGTAPCHPYDVSADNTTAILRGAPVVLNSDGYLVNATAGAGNLIKGIAADYIAASTAGKVMVWDDPDTWFVCQEDGVGTTSAQTHAGNNVDFVSTHTSANGVDSCRGPVSGQGETKSWLSISTGPALDPTCTFQAAVSLL